MHALIRNGSGNYYHLIMIGRPSIAVNFGVEHVRLFWFHDIQVFAEVEVYERCVLSDSYTLRNSDPHAATYCSRNRT